MSMPGFLVTPDPTKQLPLILYIGGTDYPKEVHLYQCWRPAHVYFKRLAVEHVCIHAFATFSCLLTKRKDDLVSEHLRFGAESKMSVLVLLLHTCRP